MLLGLGKKILWPGPLPRPVVVVVTLAELVVGAKAVYDDLRGQGKARRNHGRTDRT